MTVQERTDERVDALVIQTTRSLPFADYKVFSNTVGCASSVAMPPYSTRVAFRTRPESRDTHPPTRRSPCEIETEAGPGVFAEKEPKPAGGGRRDRIEKRFSWLAVRDGRHGGKSYYPEKPIPHERATIFALGVDEPLAAIPAFLVPAG